jgi:hypothetical protein
MKIYVTMNVAASGYSRSAPKLPYLEGEGMTWRSIWELKNYCRIHGRVAVVTPCEHTGLKSYRGDGGYRFRHSQAFEIRPE